VEMTRKYRKEHDLMGYEAEELINEVDGISHEDVVQYIYPDDKELERVGVRGIYLNNYIRWDSKVQHEAMIALYGYETKEQTRTFDTYNDVDCWNYSDVHDYVKYLKHGYGKVTDHASREIRLRRMTRKQGIDLVKKYTPLKPQNLSHFLEWIGMTGNSFHYIIDQHRNKDIWKRNDEWEWELTDNILENDKLLNTGESKAELSLKESWKDFVLTPVKQSTDKKNNYILIGKGYHE
jgi:hypothetical protein